MFAHSLQPAPHRNVMHLRRILEQPESFSVLLDFVAAQHPDDFYILEIWSDANDCAAHPNDAASVSASRTLCQALLAAPAVRLLDGRRELGRQIKAYKMMHVRGGGGGGTPQSLSLSLCNLIKEACVHTLATEIYPYFRRDCAQFKEV